MCGRRLAERHARRPSWAAKREHSSGLDPDAEAGGDEATACIGAGNPDRVAQMATQQPGFLLKEYRERAAFHTPQ